MRIIQEATPGVGNPSDTETTPTEISPSIFTDEELLDHLRQRGVIPMASIPTTTPANNPLATPTTCQPPQLPTSRVHDPMMQRVGTQPFTTPTFPVSGSATMMSNTTGLQGQVQGEYTATTSFVPSVSQNAQTVPLEQSINFARSVPSFVPSNIPFRPLLMKIHQLRSADSKNPPTAKCLIQKPTNCSVDR